MSKDSKKNKTSFKEGAGPFGVGDSVADLKTLNIFEALQESSAYQELTKDLSSDQEAHVTKEAQMHADAYQKIYAKIFEVLSTKEGKEAFRKMAAKKMQGR